MKKFFSALIIIVLLAIFVLLVYKTDALGKINGLLDRLMVA